MELSQKSLEGHFLKKTKLGGHCVSEFPVKQIINPLKYERRIKQKHTKTRCTFLSLLRFVALKDMRHQLVLIVQWFVTEFGLDRDKSDTSMKFGT